MDQAESLRKLMRTHQSRLNRRLAGERPSARVFSISSAREGEGANTIATMLAAVCSANPAEKVLFIHRSKTGFAMGARGADQMKRHSSGAYFASETFVAETIGEDDWADLGFSSVIIDAEPGLDDAKLRFHSPHYRSIVVLTPSEVSLFEGYKHVKLLNTRAGVKKLDVIVSGVTCPREGRQIFAQLEEVSDQFLELELSYSGHILLNEKNNRAVLENSFLVDWKCGSGAVSPELHSIAKKLGLVLDSASDALSMDASPAHDAPLG